MTDVESASSFVAPKVCLLGHANPAAWMSHLVEAFQRTCDLRTVGPVPDSYPRDAAPSVWPPAHHVDVDLASLGSLFDVLPAGWVPDLVVAVSGGGVPLLTQTRDLPCPTVFYSVDTWQCYMDYSEARHYDIVFAGQRPYVSHLRATGSRHVFWLPLACNPKVHYPGVKRGDFDVVFVGGIHKPVHWQRADLIRALQTRHTVLVEDGLYGEPMRDAFAYGRLAFNHSAVEDVNMRIFEALSMGCALLTNSEANAAGLDTLFRDGEHLVVYSSRDELLEKTARYLADPAACDSIRAAGRAEVLARHTYDHRVATILNTVTSLLPAFPGAESSRTLHPQTPIDLLPRIPGAVVDFGMRAATSRYALARRGVTRFAGVSSDRQRLTQRCRSYDDAVDTPPPTWQESFDTALLDAGDVNDYSLRDAWNALAPGGTLVLANAQHNALRDVDLARWLLQHDFHFTHSANSNEGTLAVAARKRTRKLRDIAVEVCERLKVPGVNGDLVASLLDPDW